MRPIVRAVSWSAIALVLGVLGCVDEAGEQERARLAGRVNALADTVTQLRDTIAALRATPTQRYAAARAAEAAGRSAEAEQGYRTLTAQYASSPEATQASARLAVIAQARAAQAEAAKAAEQRAAAVQAARERALLTGVTKRYDDMQGTTWYSPTGAAGFDVPVHLYLGEKSSGLVWLRLWMGTRTESWIFWERVIFNVDGTLLTYEVPHRDKQSDVGYGSVREWVDLPLDDVWETRFRQMAAAKSVKVRFDGKFIRDVTLSTATRAKLQLILDLYDQKQGRPLATRE